jgi:hypothetical protein
MTKNYEFKIKENFLVNKISWIILIIAFYGCDQYVPSNSDYGIGGGAALGAGLGAIVGNQVGNSGAGLAIGATAGGLLGGIVGNQYDEIEDKSNEQDTVLRHQTMELDRQKRELEDLRRQQYYDRSLGAFSNSGSEKEVWSGEGTGAIEAVDKFENNDQKEVNEIKNERY